MRARILLIASILFSFTVSSNGDVEALIDEVMKAYGGTAAWERVAGFEQEGRVSAKRRNTTGMISRTFTRPNRLLVSIDYGEEAPEERLLEGKRGYRGGAAVQGPMLTSMILQAARMDLPYILYDRRSEVSDLGVIDRDGKQFRLLEVDLGDSMNLKIKVDPESNQILESVGSAKVDGFPGGAIEFVTKYSDFRIVDGLLFAFAEENIAMGQATGETFIDRVTLSEEF